MKRFVTCGLVLALGCHARGAANPASPRPSTSPLGGEEARANDAPSRPAFARRLDPRMTFADLLGRIETLEADSSERPACLVSTTNDGYSVEASIAPAMRPIPTTVTGLDAQLDGSRGVAVLSRWGRRGDGSIAVATLTHLPPIVDEPVDVVFVTKRRIVVRTTSTGATSTAAGEVSLPALPNALREGSVVVVAADGSVPLVRVRDVLAALDSSTRSVALGVVLPEGARVPPNVPPAARTAIERCSELPELPGEAREGSLPVSALRDGLARLRGAVPACLAASSSAQVARGGRLELLVRIAPDGEAKLACARSDSIEDDGFRMCVVAAARALRFALPEPPGYVDAAFPLTIAPDPTLANRALCDALTVRDGARPTGP